MKILWKLHEPLGKFVSLTENFSEHFIFSNKHELNKTFHKLYFIVVTLTKGLTLKVKEIFKPLSQATKLFLVWYTTRFLMTLMRLHITEQQINKGAFKIVSKRVWNCYQIILTKLYLICNKMNTRKFLFTLLYRYLLLKQPLKKINTEIRYLKHKK